MSAYTISDSLKQTLILDDDTIFAKLDSLFSYRNLLACCVDGLEGCSRGNALHVLQLIATGTMRWKKHFELFRAKDFSEGRPDSGCHSFGIPARTLYRTLRVLKENNLIVSMTSRRGQDVYYALNLKTIMAKVQQEIGKRRGKSILWQETVQLYESILNSTDFEVLVASIERFAGRVISDIKSFLESLQSIGGQAVNKLGTTLTAAKKKAKEHSEMKARAKADRPIINGNGDVCPLVALEVWHRDVRDTEKHPGYAPNRTGKVVGQMKNWLKELVAQGNNEDAIRDLIRDTVRKWGNVRESHRELQCTTAQGKAYSMRMPGTPNFEIFYAHRTAILPVLAVTYAPTLPKIGEEPVQRNFR
jgi:hypothetical protein